MTRSAPPFRRFILEAFDRTQWCAVLQAIVHVSDLDALRSILGDAADDDPDLELTYHLGDEQLAAVVAKFDARFDPKPLNIDDLVISLFPWRRNQDAPYLIHTGYELPLLLEGRKKLARMSHPYPPGTFEGEDRFDDWVAKRVLHREEVIEPFGRPMNGYLGHRTVYYTTRGEEWRIPASKLIWHAAEKSGGWNAHCERFEGMLYGYEDWQNDWWINTRQQRGEIGGMNLCCPVTSSGMAWIEAAGFRALPPVDKPNLAIASYDVDEQGELRAFLLEDPDNVAVVRFNVFGRVLERYIDIRPKSPWRFPADGIPDLNRNLRGAIVIVAHREDLTCPTGS
ncbi:MAG TPA: hypothetical protein VMQ11_04535 [Alphaproteobacteria bacterium]|nr:hypothetical protein [Alphaproteobacteria bacterium]